MGEPGPGEEELTGKTSRTLKWKLLSLMGVWNLRITLSRCNPLRESLR